MANKIDSDPADDVSLGIALPNALAAAIAETASDFISQMNERAAARPSERATLAARRENFTVLGYALIGDDSRQRQIEDLLDVLRDVEPSMMNHARWRKAAFTGLEPQGMFARRSAGTPSVDPSCFEEARLPNLWELAEPLRYARFYRGGIGVLASIYAEDAFPLGGVLPYGPPAADVGCFLDSMNSTFLLHSVLAHASFVGRRLGRVDKVVVRTEWRGLAGRILLRPGQGAIRRDRPDHDPLPAEIVIEWRDLELAYDDSLCRVLRPLFRHFPTQVHPFYGDVLTPAFVRTELARFDWGTVRSLQGQEERVQ